MTVGPFEVLDAVTAGVADMYHSDDAYFPSRSPALYFFGAVPYGMTADEFMAWITFGGGQALWDEVGARFNIKPLASCTSGDHLARGWTSRSACTTQPTITTTPASPSPPDRALIETAAIAVDAFARQTFTAENIKALPDCRGSRSRASWHSSRDTPSSAGAWIGALWGRPGARRYATSPEITSFTLVASCLRLKGFGRKWISLSESSLWRNESSV